MGVRRRLTLMAAAASLASARSVHADTVVQIPIDALLDARPVSTFTNGKVVPWTTGQGIDATDGLVTSAVETKLGQTGVALPDDGEFPADSDHPEVVLHFANAAPATSSQAHELIGAGQFQFQVPLGAYSKLYLFMTSSYGDSPLTVTMLYADGVPSSLSFTVPDWGTGMPLPTSPPIFFNLISGMHKWTAQDQQVDVAVHTVTGVVIGTDSTRNLVSVQVDKPGSTQDLIFWGATGIASTIDAGVADGAADAEDVGDEPLPGQIGASQEASLDEASASGDSGSLDSSAGDTGSAGQATSGSASSGGAAGSTMAHAGAIESASGAPAASGIANGGCSFLAAPSRVAQRSLAGRNVALPSVVLAISVAARRRRRRRSE